MIYIIILFSFLLLIFVKVYTGIPKKYIILLGIVLVIIGVAFSIVSEETKDIDELMLPFGSETDLSRNIAIREVGKDLYDFTYTTIFYNLNEPYEDNFLYPTLDLLPDEEVLITVSLDKGYVGDYKIYLPKINNSDNSIIELKNFISEKDRDKDVFSLSANSAIGTTPNTIIVNINSDKPLTKSSEFLISLGLKKDNLIFDKVNSAGIGVIDDMNFNIDFQNSKSNDEKIRLIINESKLENTGVEFSTKAVSRNSEIGLDIPLSLSMFSPFTLTFENLYDFVKDENDTNLGGLKPSNEENVFYKDLPLDKTRVYSYLYPRNSYLIELKNDYNELIPNKLRPFFYATVTKGGSIIIGQNRNVDFVSDYYNLIIEDNMFVSIEFLDKENTHKFLLYEINENGTSVLNENLFSINNDNFLEEENEKSQSNIFIKDNNDAEYKLDNIISFPTNKNKTYVFMEDKDENPIIIEMFKKDDGDLDIVVQGKSIEFFENKSIFHNIVDSSESSLTLYNLKLNNNKILID